MVLYVVVSLLHGSFSKQSSTNGRSGDEILPNMIEAILLIFDIMIVGQLDRP